MGKIGNLSNGLDERISMATGHSSATQRALFNLHTSRILLARSAVLLKQGSRKVWRSNTLVFLQPLWGRVGLALLG
eukprot:1091640-Pyramimonas_sp.AAC.1